MTTALSTDGGWATRLARMLRDGARMGVLGRDVGVRLVEVGGGGCLLETDSAVDAGLSGRLIVAVQGHAFEDDVQIVRAQPAVHSGMRYRLGARLMAPRLSTVRSLRLLVGNGAESGQS